MRNPGWCWLLLAAVSLAGCGTTRSTDSQRTATEQLLISDAIDRAVQTVQFNVLAGQTVYLDESHLEGAVDRHYLVSSLRQHMLANGCLLRDERESAEFVVEARAGAVGTDRHDLLFGIPQLNVPQIFPMQPTPAAIPEIPFAKRRDQQGIAKIAVFAYHRESGQPVWQSGLARENSSSNDVWILGAGPFQRGTIHDGTTFAGNALRDDDDDARAARPTINLAEGKVFRSPEQLASRPQEQQTGGVVHASHEAPQPIPAPAEPPPAAAPSASPPDRAPASRYSFHPEPRPFEPDTYR